MIQRGNEQLNTSGADEAPSPDVESIAQIIYEGDPDTQLNRGRSGRRTVALAALGLYFFGSGISTGLANYYENYGLVTRSTIESGDSVVTKYDPQHFALEMVAIEVRNTSKTRKSNRVRAFGHDIIETGSREVVADGKVDLNAIVDTYIEKEFHEPSKTMTLTLDAGGIEFQAYLDPAETTITRDGGRTSSWADAGSALFGNHDTEVEKRYAELTSAAGVANIETAVNNCGELLFDTVMDVVEANVLELAEIGRTDPDIVYEVNVVNDNAFNKDQNPLARISTNNDDSVAQLREDGFEITQNSGECVVPPEIQEMRNNNSTLESTQAAGNEGRP